MATYTVTVKDVNGEETTVECADDELMWKRQVLMLLTLVVLVRVVHVLVR